MRITDRGKTYEMQGAYFHSPSEHMVRSYLFINF